MDRVLIFSCFMILISLYSCEDSEYETIKMQPVEGGTFLMGGLESDGDELKDITQDHPIHKVTLKRFYISKTEVTLGQWMSIMDSFPKNINTSNPLLPVSNISWNEAQNFIKKLNSKTGKEYRLPTEAEWEFAARGGINSSNFKYCRGGNNFNEYSWLRPNSGQLTHPVAQKKPNELGLYDMTGNVWEWCQDYYGNYTKSDKTNPKGPIEGKERVNKGGGFLDAQILFRIGKRSGNSPTFKYRTLGFRLASD